MASPTSKGPEGIFGSRVRARILGYLAQSSDPPTAYAIAKALAIGVSNAYPELKRLEDWAIVSSRPDSNGSKVYLLADEDLRRFLLRRVRIISSKEWFSADRIAMREVQSQEARRLLVRVPRTRTPRKDRPFAEEFRRPPEKDRALRRLRRAPGGAP